MNLQSSTKEGPRVYGFWAFVVQSLKYAPIGKKIFWTTRNVNLCNCINDPGSISFKFWELRLWCLMPLSTIFQLYRCCQFYSILVEKTGVPGENQWPSKVTDNIYHTMLYRVHLAVSRIRTHNASGDIIGTDSNYMYHVITTTVPLWSSN